MLKNRNMKMLKIQMQQNHKPLVHHQDRHEYPPHVVLMHAEVHISLLNIDDVSKKRLWEIQLKYGNPEKY